MNALIREIKVRSIQGEFLKRTRFVESPSYMLQYQYDRSLKDMPITDPYPPHSLKENVLSIGKLCGCSDPEMFSLKDSMDNNPLVSFQNCP